MHVPLPAPLEDLPKDAVVAFDLDGTLVDPGARDPERGPQKGPVRDQAAAWARELRTRGHPVFIITGRDEKWRERTWKDLERIFQTGRDALDDVTLEMQHEWVGWRTAVRKKADALRRHGCSVIIGDQAHLDGKAAKEAGIRFLDVAKLERDTGT